MGLFDSLEGRADPSLFAEATTRGEPGVIPESVMGLDLHRILAENPYLYSDVWWSARGFRPAADENQDEVLSELLGAAFSFLSGGLRPPEGTNQNAIWPELATSGHPVLWREHLRAHNQVYHEMHEAGHHGAFDPMHVPPDMEGVAH
jgi:hypothetical protein